MDHSFCSLHEAQLSNNILQSKEGVVLKHFARFLSHFAAIRTAVGQGGERLNQQPWRRPAGLISTTVQSSEVVVGLGKGKGV